MKLKNWINADIYNYEVCTRNTEHGEQVLKGDHNFNFEYFIYKVGSKWEILRNSRIYKFKPQGEI